MFEFNSKNQSGFALLEVVISLIIMVVVLTSLMISISYARYKSLTNYHDRIVLLGLQSELHKIKHRYATEGNVDIVANNTQILIENNPGNKMVAEVTFSKSLHVDPSISTSTRYWILKAKAVWYEYPTIVGFGKPYRQRKVIVLREDYYVDR